MGKVIFLTLLFWVTMLLPTALIGAALYRAFRGN